MSRHPLAVRLTTLLVLVAACGGEAPPPPAGGSGGGAAATAGGDLTPFQLEHGIGPVTEPVSLAAIDHEMAEEGEEVFQTKCSACHKMQEKYVGPALGGVTERRTPAFIMNMILNPQEMIERHPVVKQLVAEHMSFMPNQNVTRDEARQIVEYLRTQATPAAQ